MAQPVSGQTTSDEQRSRILDEQIKKWSESDSLVTMPWDSRFRVAYRVESKSAHSAVVSKQGKGLGVGWHIAHAIVAMLTGGLGLIVWIYLGFEKSPNRIERFRIDVDPAGRVKSSKISAAGS